MDAIKAFDRLERTGGGTFFPLFIFVVGMLLTVAVCKSIQQLDARIEKEIRNQPKEMNPDDIVVMERRIGDDFA